MFVQVILVFGAKGSFRHNNFEVLQKNVRAFLDIAMSDVVVQRSVA